MSGSAPAFGERHQSCDPRLRGNPLCGLGQLEGSYRPLRIQIPGASAEEVVAGRIKQDGFEPRFGIFIIGEAPGRQEDLAGIPFVGDSGQLLRDILEKSGIPLLETFVTNIVRCKPPKNRDPGANEIKACLTHLYFEFRKFSPRVVICCGRIALKAFGLDREGGITHVRGKVYERKLPMWEDGPTFKVIPTFHPAYIAYKGGDPKLKARVTQDFILARQVYEGTATSEPVYQIQYKLCETVQDVSAAAGEILAAGQVAVDTESPDVQFRSVPMITTQLSTGKNQNWVIPFWRHDPDVKYGQWKLRAQWGEAERGEVSTILRELFTHPDLTVFAHNAKYDLNVLRAWCGVEIAGPVHDSCCLHHLLHELPPHGLDYLADIEFQYGDWEARVRNIVGHGRKRKSYDNIPDDVLHPYGATDAEACFRLGQLYLSQVHEKPHLRRLYESETYAATEIFQESEWSGVRISKPDLDKLATFYTRERERLIAECREIVGDAEFNPGSHDQLKDFLIKVGFAQKIAAPASTKGYSTAADVIAKIDHSLCPLILKYRTYQKMKSTYVENLMKDIQLDGRVRYSMRIHGTTSGRQACTIYHQIPRTDEDLEEEAGADLRDLFIEEDGYSIIYGDFKQVEFFLLAYESQEKALIAALEGGQNMHKISAAAVLNIPVEECDDFNRSSVGKPFNFGVAYGSMGGQIAQCKFKNPRTGLIELVGQERAKLFVENFHKRFPRIRQFQAELLDTALVNGCIVRSRFGRERRLPELISSDPIKRSHAEREAINFKIQSPAASLTTRTMIEIRKWLKHYDVGYDKVRLLFPVHDALLYGVRDDLVEWFRECFHRCAQRTIPEYNKNFLMDVGVGRSWAEAEKNSKKK